MTFYNPGNPIAMEAAKLGRGARRLHVEFIERQVSSVKELQAALWALKAGEADAYFYTSDAMMVSQAQLIIEMARERGGRRCSTSHSLSLREVSPVTV